MINAHFSFSAFENTTTAPPIEIGNYSKFFSLSCRYLAWSSVMEAFDILNVLLDPVMRNKILKKQDAVLFISYLCILSPYVLILLAGKGSETRILRGRIYFADSAFDSL